MQRSSFTRREIQLREAPESIRQTKKGGVQPVTGGPGTSTITPFALPNHGVTVAAGLKALIREFNRNDARWPSGQPKLVKDERF